MKKIISLVLSLAMVFTMLVIPTVAAEPYTATFEARLVGDAVPEVGQKFSVAVVLKNVSSQEFKNGSIYWEYPATVASTVDSWEDEPVVATPDMSLANVYNEFVNKRQGKFASLVKEIADRENAVVTTIYIDPNAKDQELEAVETELVLFEHQFVLNEGQTYDDFYFNIYRADAYLNADGILSSAADTVVDAGVEVANVNKITVESIEKKVEVVWVNNSGQPGFNGNLDEETDTDGVFKLPQVITGVADVEYDFEITGNQGDSLMAISNSAAVTGNNYFGSSTVMMKPDADGFKFRNGSNNVPGFTPAVNTVYHIVLSIDLINNVWGVTVTDDGAEVYTASNLAFRVDADSLDAMVLTQNGGGVSGAFSVKNVVVTDKTPATVGTMTFKYVDAEGNELKTVDRTAEVGTEVSVAEETFTVGDVEYKAPAASAELVDGAVKEVVCAKVEVVTVSYTVDGTEVGTVTVKGVDGEEVNYDAYTYCTTEAIYTAEAGTLTVDADNLTVEVALTVAYEGIVATAKQKQESIHDLPEAITGTATFSYDVVLLSPSDGLVAFAEKADLADNFFAQSSAYLAFKGDKVSYRQKTDTANVEFATVTVPGTYKVEGKIDVAAKTWTVSIADAEGTVLGTATDISYRNLDVEALDAIVVLDNADEAAGDLVVQNLVVDVEGDVATDEPSSDVATDEPSSDVATDEPEVDEDYEYTAFIETKEEGALGAFISGRFKLTDDTHVATDYVIVVTTFYLDGKPLSVSASKVSVINGEVEFAERTSVEGATVYSVMIVEGIKNPLDTIVFGEGNMGTPVGSWRADLNN